jgi:hypothetical protein
MKFFKIYFYYHFIYYYIMNLYRFWREVSCNKLANGNVFFLSSRALVRSGAKPMSGLNVAARRVARPPAAKSSLAARCPNVRVSAMNSAIHGYDDGGAVSALLMMIRGAGLPSCVRDRALPARIRFCRCRGKTCFGLSG